MRRQRSMDELARMLREVCPGCGHGSGSHTRVLPGQVIDPETVTAEDLRRRRPAQVRTTVETCPVCGRTGERTIRRIKLVAGNTA